MRNLLSVAILLLSSSAYATEPIQGLTFGVGVEGGWANEVVNGGVEASVTAHMDREDRPGLEHLYGFHRLTFSSANNAISIDGQGHWGIQLLGADDGLGFHLGFEEALLFHAGLGEDGRENYFLTGPLGSAGVEWASDNLNILLLARAGTIVSPPGAGLSDEESGFVYGAGAYVGSKVLTTSLEATRLAGENEGRPVDRFTLDLSLKLPKDLGGLGLAGTALWAHEGDFKGDSLQTRPDNESIEAVGSLEYRKAF